MADCGRLAKVVLFHQHMLHSSQVRAGVSCAALL
jgi:hypothetical protein